MIYGINGLNYLSKQLMVKICTSILFYGAKKNIHQLADPQKLTTVFASIVVDK